MKIFKKIILVFFFILLIFCVYVQYIKSKFDRVYSQREFHHRYDDLYTSGALNQFKKFAIDNYYFTIQELSKSAYKGKIRLNKLKQYANNDTVVINSINRLIDDGFYDVRIQQQFDINKIEIYFEKIYLIYKNTPTYHCIIYNTRRGYEYQFDKNEDWYFFIVDDKEADLGSFLDPRPKWTLPYFEAFSFFKENPNYEMDK